jgi:hypothetical protein
MASLMNLPGISKTEELWYSENNLPSQDRGNKVATSEEQSIKADIPAPLMRKVNIRNANLAQAFNRRANEALDNLVGDPLAVGFGVGSPYLRGHGRENRDEIDGPLSILQG